ncbi:MAG: bifunctional folylpolyglutamate synthase/dihydrofolate synthase [Prolixibacteraceae bacterium]
MNYTETLDYLFSRLPVYQRIGPAAYKSSLENTYRLDELYGHPHRKFKSVHVAGTNGKGSVSHMLAAILQSAGYKTGLYTSPHLKDFRERIRINGEMVSQNEVIEWVENYRTRNEVWKMEPSFFELTVALAFDFFATHEVDIAVVEVGLGGRLDSTNIITPEVGIITNISLDHVALLGDDIEKIAAEKAGIIKQGVPAVIGTTQPEIRHVFEQKAIETKSSLFFADQEYTVEYALRDFEGNQLLSVTHNSKKILPDLKLDLKGSYQLKNLPAVFKTIELLRNKNWNIRENHIYKGLASVTQITGLKGRWQVIGNNPLTVCDTGHNQGGIKEVVNQISQTPHKNLHIVFGMVNDKNAENILKLLPQNARYYFTKADIPRALDEKILLSKAFKLGLCGESFPTVIQALTAARKDAGKNDFIFIGGSTFVVAEIYD